MRFSRYGLFVLLLLLSVPGWAQQTTGTQATSQTASDPQAVAVVQAAITALGGSAAISQAKSWTFQGTVQGPIANGNVNYTVTTALDTTSNTLSSNGVKKPGPLIRSLFVPVAVTHLAQNLHKQILRAHRGKQGQPSVTTACDEVEVAQSVPTPQAFRHHKSNQKPRP